ncbi:hypothetical protein, partial [Salmonella enterica]|uniref:hypothetical protein n=1 Tax=Salmonella enterica TaxID=28901 RepID=UPI001C4DDB57
IIKKVIDEKNMLFIKPWHHSFSIVLYGSTRHHASESASISHCYLVGYDYSQWANCTQLLE